MRITVRISFGEKRLRECKLCFLASELCSSLFPTLQDVSQCSSALKDLWSASDFSSLPIGYQKILKSMKGGLSSKRRCQDTEVPLQTFPAPCLNQSSTVFTTPLNASAVPKVQTGWNAFVAHRFPILRVQHPLEQNPMVLLSAEWTTLGKPAGWTMPM
jgi:hypothetical protein